MVTSSPKSIIYHNQGIDTIRLTAVYKSVVNLLHKEGLTPSTPKKNSPVSRTVQTLLKEFSNDTTTRYKRDQFPPVVEVVKLSKEKGLSNYMIIIRNTPLLFDLAEYHKTPKDKYCLIVFAGLHQPTKSINSDVMKFISRVTKRKAFKLQSLDIAIDIEDKRSINETNKEAFRANLMPFSKHGIHREGTSYYVNHSPIGKICYYDKYSKDTKYHKRKGLHNNLRAWKRLEVTLSFNITKSKNFTQYIESHEFINDLEDIDQVARLAGVKGFERCYLLYQLNSLIDNRFMNNHESQEQFNSVEALERFRISDFRRYIVNE